VGHDTRKLLVRVGSGVFLLLILLAVTSFAFRLGFFWGHEKAVALALAVIYVVFIVSCSRFDAGPGQRQDEVTTVPQQSSSKLASPEFLSWLCALGIVFFGIVPAYVRGDALSMSAVAKVVIGAAIAGWVIRRAGIRRRS
jgi:hypothetical protein